IIGREDRGAGRDPAAPSNAVGGRPAAAPARLRRGSVAAESVAEAAAGVAEGLPQVASAPRRGPLLPAGLAHLPQVALEHRGTAEHHEEADDPDGPGRRERGDQHDEAGDEPERGPFEVATGMAVEGRRADVVREGRIVLVELLLDLLEDPLFVLGKRHASYPSPAATTQPSSHRAV